MVVVEKTLNSLSAERRLSDLPPNVFATVKSVTTLPTDVSGNLARRLAEIGFLPGESVRVLRRMAGGEPLAVRIGDSTFALRRYEAECIAVSYETTLST